MKTDNDIEHDIEQLLIRGKTVSLSGEDKATIKSALLAHAADTLRHEKHSVHSPVRSPMRSPWASWFMRGSVSLASLMTIFVGTAYASQGSLPGETLYPVKVRVVEEVIALTKTEPHARIAYDVSLMETRLGELQALADKPETPKPEVLASVTEQINEHVADMTSTLNATNPSVVTHEEKIDALSKLAGVAKAQVKMTQNENDLSAITQTMQDTQEATTDSLTSAVHTFADTQSTSSVSTYLSDHISAASDQLTASTTRTETRDSAEQQLHDVDESLSDGNTTDALISALEAQQTIAVDEYLKKPDQETKDKEPKDASSEEAETVTKEVP